MSNGSTLAPGMEKGIETTVTPQQQAIYNAWSIDEGWNDYIYYAWYGMYALTIFPSVAALPFIYVLKGFVNIYLFVDMWLRLAGLAFHDAKEAYIWTLEYWF